MYGPARPIWRNAMNDTLKSLRGDAYSVHGMRACFSGDWAAKRGYSTEHRENGFGARYWRRGFRSL